jgi:hypothetical protein
MMAAMIIIVSGSVISMGFSLMAGTQANLGVERRGDVGPARRHGAVAPRAPVGRVPRG